MTGIGAASIGAIGSTLIAPRAACAVDSGGGALAGKRPNIVLVMTDDQGYGDLACHGNPIVITPHLDRMHDESVRLTDFHVSPTCSPTRCAIMTGRHEFKSGVTHTIKERERMSLKAVTIAQVLKSAGYTTGIFGKWHLGDEPERRPDKRGFDEVFIHGAGGIGQTFPGSCGDAPGNKYMDPCILHNNVFEKTNGFCTDVFFAQATKWIESVKGKTPFFCYIPTNAAHGPLSCPEKYEKLYEGKVNANAAKFFGMITNIDDNVGALLGRLREWGIERDTLVIFMTDNGGTAGRSVWNAGMKTGKGSAYNGGARAIGFFRWPTTLVPADVNQLTAHVDLYPTFAQLAGAQIPASVKLDGFSLLPLLKDPSAPWPDRYLFTHVGRWEEGKAAESKYRSCSVRHGKYIMVNAAPKGGKTGGGWELYDLKADPGETTDIAAQHPEIVQEMSAAYDKWWDEVLPCLENEDANGPDVNPFKELYWKQYAGPGPNNVAPGTYPKQQQRQPPQRQKSAKKQTPASS